MSCIRIRKNLLGATEPQSKPKEIRDLFNPEYFDKINIRPRYQRHIRWKLDAMCELIYTVMNNGLVPGVIMYQLHPKDKAEHQGKYNYEVPDGQHRLFTINAFKSSSVQKLPHIKKPFIVHWIHVTYDESGNKHIQRVFYRNTPEVHDWYRETYNKEGGIPFFLDEDEKEAFDNYSLGVTMIRSELSMDERREIFMSLQNGIPVRNSDYLKNMISCKLIAYFDCNGYEEMMSVFFTYCSKKAMSFWVQWAVRCFLLFTHATQEQSIESDLVKIFLQDDGDILKDIKTNKIELNPSNENMDKFDDKFRNVIEFLQTLPEEIQLNPTQMFSVVYRLFFDDAQPNIIATHMKLFSKDGQKKENKSLWKGDNKELRKSYFIACITELKNMTHVANPIDTRQPSKSMKKKVFEKAKVKGNCDTCGTKITLGKFHCGHILARARGGLLELDNLIPLCESCNLGMGTQTPDYYMTKVLPYK